MVRKLYKQLGNLKIYLSDRTLVGKVIEIDRNAPNRDLLMLQKVREYNMTQCGQKDCGESKIIEKCRRNPLLIPHRLFREECKIKRRERRNDR